MRTVPFRDGFSTPGDVYEPEPGRNLDAMLTGGDIVEIPDIALSPEERDEMAKKNPAAGGTEPVPSHVEREQQAGLKGIVTSNPPVPDVEEAAAGVQDLDHAGTGAPTRDDAEALAERQRAVQEAAADPPRPLDADEQVKQGETPASQPDQQLDQASGGASSTEPAGSAGADLVGPGYGEEEDRDSDAKSRGGRRGRR